MPTSKCLKSRIKQFRFGAVVVVKWSASLPSTLTIRLRIPLKPKVSSVKFVFEKNKKRQGLAHYLKNKTLQWPIL